MSVNNTKASELEVSFGRAVDKGIEELRRQAGELALQSLSVDAMQMRSDYQRQALMLLGRADGLRDAVRMLASLRYSGPKP